MNKYLDIEKSRFYDPLSMAPQVSVWRAPPTDSRNARLENAIKTYGDAREDHGSGAAVDRALAACMQLVDQK